MLSEDTQTSFSEENISDNVIYKMLAILFRPQCINIEAMPRRPFVTGVHVQNLRLWLLRHVHVLTELFFFAPIIYYHSLAPGRFYLMTFRWLIIMLILVIDDWCISCEIDIRWMWQDFTDDKSTLVQVMDWCRQATSHYLSQRWPRSMLPYGITRPQWVNCAQWCHLYRSVSTLAQLMACCLTAPSH